MANVREAADDPRLSSRAHMAQAQAGCDMGYEDGPDNDIDWCHDEDGTLMGHLEEARRAMKDKDQNRSEKKLNKAFLAFQDHKQARRPPPFFEEPTYVFSCILALLLAHMVPLEEECDGAPGRREVLAFFNAGNRYYNNLLGTDGSGQDVPRILPVRVLLRNFAMTEIKRPHCTAFVDANNPAFCGSKVGKFRIAGMRPSRKVSGHGELGAGGAL